MTKRTQHFASALLAAAALAAAPSIAHADDCATVTATMRAQEAMTYKLVLNGQPRMIHTPTAMYVHAGNAWRKMPSGAGMQEAAHRAVTYASCRQTGHEAVNGIPATVYEFTVHAEGIPDKQGKLWVGNDGHVYRFHSGTQLEEFDYTNIQLPAS